jgi:oxygen-independent coproporphyrinogen-3 oxidase
MPVLPKTIDPLAGTALPTNDRAENAAIYVHWPFCEKKCPYCDFNSHVREKVDQAGWQKAMLREIDTFAAHFPSLKAKSIFFGGGTPSLMPPETTALIIERIQTYWAADEAIEVTLEANPSSMESARFHDYAQAGVNRVSVGVQSFKDKSLKFLGRLHNADEATKALEVARTNFKRVSFDLIYALPEQSLQDWQAELQHALGFSPSHLSLYQLTIEEGTAFYHQFKRGKFSLPDEALAAALFETTQLMTEEAGLPAYETSNHAKTGQQSEHNLAYWRGEPYVGIGPGAHGRLPGLGVGTAYGHQQIKRPEDWLNTVQATGCGLESLEEIDRESRAIEAIMMGLRLREGVNLPAFRDRFGLDIKQFLDNDAVADLIAEGYLQESENRLAVTAKGTPLLNFLLPKIIT